MASARACGGTHAAGIESGHRSQPAHGAPAPDSPSPRPGARLVSRQPSCTVPGAEPQQRPAARAAFPATSIPFPGAQPAVGRRDTSRGGPRPPQPPQDAAAPAASTHRGGRVDAHGWQRRSAGEELRVKKSCGASALPAAAPRSYSARCQLGNPRDSSRGRTVGGLCHRCVTRNHRQPLSWTFLISPRY